MDSATVKSIARSTISRALAEALIGGIHQVCEEGDGLTEVQQIGMATMAIMTYHDAMQAIDVQVEGEERIQSLFSKREDGAA